jgi:hypothetical protein
MAVVEVDAPGRPIRFDDERFVDLGPAKKDIEPVRAAWAAAHVVMQSDYDGVDHAAHRPGRPDELAAWIDWDATTRVRVDLVSHGLGIAEAMDTAQRYEIGWPAAKELIERCAELAAPLPFVAGAGTDHAGAIGSIDDLVAAVSEQCRLIHGLGGIPMVLAMPWLAQHGADRDAYVRTYTQIIERAEGPLLVHWLGAMFLPALEGYFPDDSFDRIMSADPSVVRGAKLSLLDPGREIALRRKLLERDQLMLTGDDFHFGTLIEGDAVPPPRTVPLGDVDLPIGDFSHALLGILDGIARPASIALRCLADADLGAYREIMAPCERLGQLIFAEPTHDYKAGLAFLAWLNGRQDVFGLPNHAERARSAAHLVEVARLAADAGAITNATTAAGRLASLLDRAGNAQGVSP